MLLGIKQCDIPTSAKVRDLEPGLRFSIILRTQGKRMSLLREALASLYVQTEKRFEVLLCVHSNQDAEAAVQDILWEFPEEFARRARLLSVQGGGRCRPLNKGLEAAKGAFVCFLDDDDLLLDNHFAAVSAQIEEKPGQQAFHTFGALRFVEPLSEEAYTAAGIQLSYTLPFSLPLQLIENSVPICNIFISTQLIDAFGITFDETYEVLEDWHFLMEVNRFSTVSTVPEVTTVVNMRADHSNTTNDPKLKSLWNETRERHQRHLAETPRVWAPEEMADAVRLGKYLWEYTHKAIYGKALALEPLINWIERTMPKKVIRAIRRRVKGKGS